MPSAADAVFTGVGLLATGLCDVTDDPAALDSRGFWAVLATFEGHVTCARFATVRRAAPPPAGPWRGPEPSAWRSSMTRAAFMAAVADVRARIAAGDVYQANLCRILTAPLPHPDDADVLALADVLGRRNPAPHAAALRLPDRGVHVVSASPELFLRRSGRTIESGPIKGTGRTEADLLDKDRAENVMIVDLVRNDLGRVCSVGSVTVPRLCRTERHPGLVHLVSTIRGELARGVGWGQLLGATFPPGSVSGAPKIAALDLIRELEPVPRGPYCGAMGWVDADADTAELAVAIRTFWLQDGTLRFGTGAGITWGSDAADEWDETELKAAHLLAVASGGVRQTVEERA